MLYSVFPGQNVYAPAFRFILRGPLISLYSVASRTPARYSAKKTIKNKDIISFPPPVFAQWGTIWRDKILVFIQDGMMALIIAGELCLFFRTHSALIPWPGVISPLAKD